MTNKEGEKQGFTVQEIEDMAKKYRYEAFFCVAFVLAAIFTSIISFWTYWTIYLTALGAIVGMLVPRQSEKCVGWALAFTCKQDRITQIVIGVILLVLSIVVPPFTFIMVGLMGGKSMHKDTLHHKGSHLNHNVDKNHKG